MCEKIKFKYCPNKIDKCMVECIETLKIMCYSSYLSVVSCCCGHKKYPKTIVIKNGIGECWELFTGIIIPRKKRFYKKDKEGYYYIPEISKVQAKMIKLKDYNIALELEGLVDFANFCKIQEHFNVFDWRHNQQEIIAQVIGENIENEN